MPNRVGTACRRVHLAFFLLILASLSLVSKAQADTVSMDLIGVPAGAQTLVVSDPTATPGYTNATAIIDPYIAKVNGATMLIWCVDPDHEVNISDTWTAYVSRIADVSQTYLKNATTYEELAWLISQLANTSDTLEQREIQAAIWSLADPGDFSYALSSNASFANDVSALESSATSNALTSGFEILTDIRGSKQEFIVLTPEPATISLLAMGLLAMAFSRKLIRS